MHQACGYHASQIDNYRDFPLVPDEFKCPFCSRQAQQERQWQADDEDLEKRAGKAQPGRPYPTDGLTRFLRPATAEEIEKARQRREGDGRSGVGD